ncbi:MAG: hypothetical protein M3O90_08510, partial [Actinomycetota bacterium]|nr:hypothetical protein [Actinomycetota bacterium]
RQHRRAQLLVVGLRGLAHRPEPLAHRRAPSARSTVRRCSVTPSARSSSRASSAGSGLTPPQVALWVK